MRFTPAFPSHRLSSVQVPECKRHCCPCVLSDPTASHQILPVVSVSIIRPPHVKSGILTWLLIIAGHHDRSVADVRVKDGYYCQIPDDNPSISLGSLSAVSR